MRLPHPWDSPGKNTGVGCHFLLQCMKVKSESEVAQSCPTLATPWTTAYQAPLSMAFSRQKYWSGVPLPSPPSTHSSSFLMLSCGGSASPGPPDIKEMGSGVSTSSPLNHLLCLIVASGGRNLAAHWAPLTLGGWRHQITDQPSLLLPYLISLLPGH